MDHTAHNMVYVLCNFHNCHRTIVISSNKRRPAIYDVDMVGAVGEYLDIVHIIIYCRRLSTDAENVHDFCRVRFSANVQPA